MTSPPSLPPRKSEQEEFRMRELARQQQERDKHEDEQQLKQKAVEEAKRQELASQQGEMIFPPSYPLPRETPIGKALEGIQPPPLPPSVIPVKAPSSEEFFNEDDNTPRQFDPSPSLFRRSPRDIDMKG